jgi:hypothetical protein
VKKKKKSQKGGFAGKRTAKRKVLPAALSPSRVLKRRVSILAEDAYGTLRKVKSSLPSLGAAAIEDHLEDSSKLEKTQAVKPPTFLQFFDMNQIRRT